MATQQRPSRPQKRKVRKTWLTVATALGALLGAAAEGGLLGPAAGQIIGVVLEAVADPPPSVSCSKLPRPEQFPDCR